MVNITKKAGFFILIGILIFGGIVIADESCEIIPLESFIDLTRADIIQYIDLQFTGIEISPQNLYVGYDMNTIVKRGEDYCLTRTDISTSISFEIINYCSENFDFLTCWQYLIINEEPFTFEINGVLTDIEPINYQLIHEVNMKLDQIMEIQTQVYNENLINQLIGNNTYVLPVIV